MGKYKNAIRRIQAFMDSARGKTILNYLYSWGAAVVILGTLFKLTHIAGANLMLFVGMGTEVIVFFFSGFERPYDVAIDEKKEEEAEERAAATNIIGTGLQGGTIVINGTIGGGGTIPAEGAAASSAPAVAAGTGIVAGAPAVVQGGATITGNPDLIPQMDEVTEEYINKNERLLSFKLEDKQMDYYYYPSVISTSGKYLFIVCLLFKCNFQMKSVNY